MYDDLFEPVWGGVGHSWWNAISDKARNHLTDELVDRIVDAGHEPASWKEVIRRFAAEFPDETPSENTFKDTIRQLVAERE